MEFISTLLPTIEHFRFAAYWIILFVSLLESLAFVGIVIPGTIFIILIGVVSTKGFFDLGDAVWFAAIGAILGDGISYYLGSNVKKFFREDSAILKSSYLEKGVLFFKTYGGRSIFLGRFVGPLRPIVPFVAGMFRMDKKRFFSWNIASAFAWAIAFLLLGFLFGEAWRVITLWSTRVSMVIAALTALFIAFYILKWLVVKNGKEILNFLISVWRSLKYGFINNPDIKNIVKKHPLFFQFVTRRLDKNTFSGLPTTFLVLVFVYTGTLFIGIVEDVITSDIIVSADMRVANLFALFRTAEITQLFLWITALGTWQVVVTFTIAIIGLLWVWHKRIYIVPLMIAIVGSESFTALGKIAFHRPRPALAMYTEHSFSFPSGHATIAVAFYGFVTYLALRMLKQWQLKMNVFFIGGIIILLIGLSRLYLGVHYVSDVWGGYLIGALWLIISISITEWLHSKKKGNVPYVTRIKTRVISALLVIVSLSLYITFAVHYRPPISHVSAAQEQHVIQNVHDIFTNNTLHYTETLVGKKQEPISFIILAKNDKQFIQLFRDAGWTLADTITVSSVARLIKMAALEQAYPAAPMTPSFWNLQVHNFGFEKETNANTVRERHHARFWKTPYVTGEGKYVYVGTASFDIGLKWGITHTIKPDIDTEREFLFHSLRLSHAVINSTKEPFVEPNLGKNFSGDIFFTDGKVYIITMQ